MSDQNSLTVQEKALISHSRIFRVPEMANVLEIKLEYPNADLNTFTERVTAMVDAEFQARVDKSLIIL